MTFLWVSCYHSCSQTVMFKSTTKGCPNERPTCLPKHVLGRLIPSTETIFFPSQFSGGFQFRNACICVCSDLHTEDDCTRIGEEVNNSNDNPNWQKCGEEEESVHTLQKAKETKLKQSSKSDSHNTWFHKNTSIKKKEDFLITPN